MLHSSTQSSLGSTFEVPRNDYDSEAL